MKYCFRNCVNKWNQQLFSLSNYTSSSVIPIHSIGLLYTCIDMTAEAYRAAVRSGSDLQFVCQDCKVGTPSPNILFDVADVSFWRDGSDGCSSRRRRGRIAWWRVWWATVDFWAHRQRHLARTSKAGWQRRLRLHCQTPVRSRPMSLIFNCLLGRLFDGYCHWDWVSLLLNMFPFNTRGTRPTCMRSLILIHPTVWPQYTRVTDDRQTDRQTTSHDNIRTFHCNDRLQNTLHRFFTY